MKIGCPSNRSQLGGEIGEIITSTLIGKNDEAGENGVGAIQESARGTFIPLHHPITGTSKV
jgi:hypothetical protein